MNGYGDDCLQYFNRDAIDRQEDGIKVLIKQMHKFEEEFEELKKEVQKLRKETLLF